MKYNGIFPKLPTRWYFKTGDKGTQVILLQKFLNFANDGAIFDPLEVDGEYGKLTGKAVSFFELVQGKTQDTEFGKKCLAAAKALDKTGAYKSINFAVSVAIDNSFAYGEGQRAHRSGCYFCQTNTGPRKKKKEKNGEPHVVKGQDGKKHTYTKTYCCNTLITAAYAHGAGDKKTLEVCRKGSCFGMQPSDWEQSKNFKRVGKCSAVPYSKLKPGDVIMSDSDWACHVWMYIGHGQYVEASGGTWDEDSIAVKNGAKKLYSGYQEHSKCYVVRYHG